ncbi:MAG: hypothetical protein ACRECY_12065, partial [Phyllobacterium sp.]
GMKASTGNQKMLNDQLGGEAGDNTLRRMADMGDDTMALNANDFLHAEARAARNFGGAAGETVSSALDDQFARRSDRILQGADDALGRVGTSYDDQRASLAAREKALSPAYSDLLKRTPLSAEHRTPVVEAANRAANDIPASDPLSKSLRNIGKSAAGSTAVQLRNTKNQLDTLAKSNPGARQQIYDVKRAIDAALDSASGGKYGELQSQVSAIKTQREAIERAYGLLSGRVTKKGKVKPVTPEMIQRDKAAFPSSTLDAARSRVRDNIRSGTNDLSALRQTLGRDANTAARDNATTMFGNDAVEKLARTLDNEVAKSADYASIMRGSQTARNLSAMGQSRVNGFDLVPRSLNPVSLASQYGGVAIRLFNSVFGTKNTAARRALLAKVSTMKEPELKALLGALHKANRARNAADANVARLAILSGLGVGADNER